MLLENKYRLGPELGRGATARVYAAQDLSLERQVAIKHMHLATGLSEAESEALKARFLQEGKTLAQLSHPHIPKVIEIGEWEAAPAIVMELIEGAKLYSYLQNQPPVHEVVLRLAEIADALHYAHGRGIIHRDIKPDNLQISEQQGAFLMDFGVARQTESVLQTSDGTMLGTIAYMAPEQLYNSSQADARCDIYSLGVVMYEVFTGQLPFDGESPAAVILSIFNTAPTPPGEVATGLSPRLEQLIINCLQKDPDQRLQSAKEVAYSLRQIADELGLEQKVDLNLTQIGLRRTSLPLDKAKETLGELEGLRLSHQPKGVGTVDANGDFASYGLIRGLQDARATSFSGAIKVKAKADNAASFWFKGVIWMQAGHVCHAQLIRDSLSPLEDLRELLGTPEGRMQQSENTQAPETSLTPGDLDTLIEKVLAEKGMLGSDPATPGSLLPFELVSTPLRVRAHA
ncbi:MAG: serine/threonine-protein kinase [Candidatus Sericytochromatia bacterium]